MDEKRNVTDKALHVTARVTLVIEVVSESVWSKDVTVQQVQRQASTEATEKITKAIAGTGSALHPRGLRIVGEPVVEVVTFKEKK